MSNKKILYGLYDDEVTLIDAVKKVRAEGLKIQDCYTPFPVHGLDDAMGLRATRLHNAGFIFGATGTLTALSFILWISTNNYPMNYGGPRSAKSRTSSASSSTCRSTKSSSPSVRRIA